MLFFYFFKEVNFVKQRGIRLVILQGGRIYFCCLIFVVFDILLVLVNLVRMYENCFFFVNYLILFFESRLCLLEKNGSLFKIQEKIVVIWIVMLQFSIDGIYCCIMKYYFLVI